MVLTEFWRAQFEFPCNGPRELSETTYYLDYQGVRVISLDSNQPKDSQSVWLEGVLQGNPNRWTVVTFHHPPYTTSIHRDNSEVRTSWVPMFDRYGVDLVLVGHDHNYARTRKMRNDLSVANEEEGTIYIISVAGEKMREVPPERKPVFHRTCENAQVYQLFHVDGDELLFESKTCGGKLVDSFRLVNKDSSGSTLLEELSPPSTAAEVVAMK